MASGDFSPSKDLEDAVKDVAKRAEDDLNRLLTDAMGAPVKMMVLAVVTARGAVAMIGGCACDACTAAMGRHIGLVLGEHARLGVDDFDPDATGLVH